MTSKSLDTSRIYSSGIEAVKNILLNRDKNHTHVQNFCLAFIDELEKKNYLLKKTFEVDQYKI